MAVWKAFENSRQSRVEPLNSGEIINLEVKHIRPKLLSKKGLKQNISWYSANLSGKEVSLSA